MAFQIIPQSPETSQLGKLLTGFGTGLAGGLQEGVKQFKEGQAFEKLGIPKELSRLSPELQKELIKQKEALPFEQSSPEGLSKLFESVGLQPNEAKSFANLYPRLTTGGKTQLAGVLLDKIQRGQFGSAPEEETETIDEFTTIPEKKDGIKEEKVIPEEKKGIRIPTKAAISSETFKELTPKEKVKREGELYKQNLVPYKEAEDKLFTVQTEASRVGQIEKLNEKKGALPSGLRRLILVDNEGNLRWPFLANADTQEFVKIVSDFTTSAKDTYGARVTNFELDRFMKRLPTLSNTTEGRRQIIAYMNAVNEINKVYYGSLKKVYDHYGLRNIDEQKALELAQQIGGKSLENARKKLLESDRANDLYVAKKKLPSGYTVVNVDGVYKYVKNNRIKEAIEQGAEIR